MDVDCKKIVADYEFTKINVLYLVSIMAFNTST